MCKRRYDKQAILNELARLYTLQREGKKVKSLIKELEKQLVQACDDEIDGEEQEESD